MRYTIYKNYNISSLVEWFVKFIMHQFHSSTTFLIITFISYICMSYIITIISKYWLEFAAVFSYFIVLVTILYLIMPNPGLPNFKADQLHSIKKSAFCQKTSYFMNKSELPRGNFDSGAVWHPIVFKVLAFREWFPFLSTKLTYVTIW